MTSFDSRRQDERIIEGSSHESIKKRLETLFDQDSALDTLSRQLMQYIRESSTQLRNRIKTVSASVNPVLLDSVAPFLQEIQMELTSAEISMDSWENEVRSLAETDSEFRETIQRKPQCVPAIEELGILRRMEVRIVQRIEKFIIKRMGIEDYFKSANSRISNFEKYLSSHALAPSREDIDSKLKELQRFKPGFENN